MTALISPPRISREPAVLVLEDGTRYPGRAYGARGETFGEVVFDFGGVPMHLTTQIRILEAKK